MTPQRIVGLRRRIPSLPPSVGIPMALALALFLAGPRAEVRDPDGSVQVPPDVEAWLRQLEDTVPGIRPGDEKGIVWADPATRARTNTALVYLHGFSADRHELEPVPSRVAADLGANLFFTRLRGHGRDGAAMAEASAGDWLRDTREAVAVGRALGRRVVLFGTSTGATLALWAAAQEELATDVAAIVLVSPNLQPRDHNSRLLLLPWGGLLARVVVGPERCWDPANEAQARHWTTCYPTKALLPMMALVERVRALDPARIRTPTLVLYDPADQVIDAAEVARFFGGAPRGYVRVVPFEGSGDASHHVLAGDIVSPGSTEAVRAEVTTFLRRVLEGAER